MEQEHQFIGQHVFGEFYGVDSHLLNDLNFLQEMLIAGIKESGATLCSMQSKQFEPSGVTLLALLSESHASIHTYPDMGSLFFDAFTCGDECKPEKIAEVFEKALKPKHHTLEKIRRGGE